MSFQGSRIPTHSTQQVKPKLPLQGFFHDSDDPSKKGMQEEEEEEKSEGESSWRERCECHLFPPPPHHHPLFVSRLNKH